MQNSRRSAGRSVAGIRLSELFGVRFGVAIAAVAIFSACINILMLVTPLYTIQLYTRVLTSQSIETLLVLTGAAIGVLLFSAIFDLVRRATLQRIGHRFYVMAGERVVAATLAPKSRQMDRSMPMTDLDTVRRFLSGQDIINMMDLPFSLLFLAVLFYIHPVMGMTAGALALLLLLLALVNDWISSATQRRVAAEMRQSAEQLGAFSGEAALIASMGMAAPVTERWAARQADMATALQKSEGRSSVFVALSRWLRMSLQIVILGAAAYYVLIGDLNPGMIIACSILASRAVMPIEGLIVGQREFRRMRDSLKRLHGLLAGSEGDEGTAVPRGGGVKATEIVVLSAIPGKAPALRGVSLTVATGEIVAIVGPSGAGKTLLGAMLGGAVMPSAGSVQIGGVDLRSADRASFARMLGYLPQHNDALPGTIAENVCRFGTPDSDRVWEALKLFRIDTEVARLPSQLETPMIVASRELSPGLYRRVLMARAFYGDPSLVILDEPGFSIDQEGEQIVAAVLAERARSGMSIVMISPRGPLQALANRFVVMRGGMIETIRDAGEARPQPRSVGAPTGVRLLAE